MAKCKICGSRIADGATKCPTCGSPVGATAESLQPKPHIGGSSAGNTSGLSAGVASGSVTTGLTTSVASMTGTTAGASTTAWTGSTEGAETTVTFSSILQKIVLTICVVALAIIVIVIIHGLVNVAMESYESKSSSSTTSSSTSSSSYSTQPLSVMGFTGQSTRSEVKSRLTGGGISYFEASVNKRLQGRVATSAIEVVDSLKYDNAIWSNLVLFFSPDNKLVAVQLDGYAEQDTLNAFNKMTQAYPVRTQKQTWHAMGPDEVLIKNGRNEDEYVERTIETWNEWNENLHIIFYF